jgi:hypothetical protein
VHRKAWDRERKGRNSKSQGCTYRGPNLTLSSFALCADKSLQASENITVQCMDASPMDLLLVNTPHSRRAKNQHHPFIHFDRYFGAGWSTVFASSESHVVVKFAAVPKKDKAELTRQLRNEKLAYNKLSRIAGWVVPRLYGEYEWYGRRALVLSDEGRSLSYLEKFTSLSLIERYGMP